MFAPSLTLCIDVIFFLSKILNRIYDFFQQLHVKFTQGY